MGTRPDTHILGGLPFPDPTELHIFMEDFDIFPADIVSQDAAGQAWNLNVDGAGVITPVNFSGGVIELGTGAVDTNLTLLQAISAGFELGPGNAEDTWFSSRWVLGGSGTAQTVAMGLGAPSAAIEPANGIFFTLDEGSLEIHLKVNTTESVPDIDIATGVIYDTASSAFFITSWFYDQRAERLEWAISRPAEEGADSPEIKARGSVDIPNVNPGNLPTGQLAPYAGVRTEAAQNKSIQLDYLFTASQWRGPTGF